MDKIPFEERRVIHALIVFWQCTRFSHLNQVRPSPRILGLIDRCSIGIDFFRQVYSDLCSDKRIKFVGFSESEFKQFLETEYNQPFIEQQVQAIAEEREVQERRARADFVALGEEMVKATTRTERVELGRKRANLVPYTRIRHNYESHCWNCKMPISSSIHAQCPDCTYYICSNCDACFCNRAYNTFHDEAVDPFLPDYPDDLS
jgi:hypothetical protein